MRGRRGRRSETWWWSIGLCVWTTTTRTSPPGVRRRRRRCGGRVRCAALGHGVPAPQAGAAGVPAPAARCGAGSLGERRVAAGAGVGRRDSLNVMTSASSAASSPGRHRRTVDVQQVGVDDRQGRARPGRRWRSVHDERPAIAAGRRRRRGRRPPAMRRPAAHGDGGERHGGRRAAHGISDRIDRDESPVARWIHGEAAWRDAARR